MAKYNARKPSGNMAMDMANKTQPINEMCPIKPDRRADPSITAKNSKGETVAFCCNGCKNKFAAAQPVMASKKAAPLNEMCPIKPDRRADPSITAKNSKR